MVARERDHYIMIKGSAHQEDITIDSPSIGTTKYFNQIPINLKRQIDSNTIIVGYFNIPLSAMDRSFRQKNQQRNIVLELHFRSNKPNRHI